MKKLVALMLVCMLSFPVVSAADKDSPSNTPSKKVESSTNETNVSNTNEIATNEDGVFKNVIHQRFQGENRAKTAVNVQRHYFANTNKVILVNDNAYPDAISATNVSMGKYPLLYTGKNSLSVETKSALDKMFLDEINI